jgi:uncharacterized protein DUF1707
MPDPPSVRVSDAERERAAADLREHFAAGRLTDEELSDRVAAAYAARTAADLAAVRVDLPALPASPAQARAELAERRAELRRRLLQQSGGALAPFAICTVIWVATGANGMFWPIWVALFTVIPLLRNGWRLYGPAPELDRVEQDLARRERGERRHDRGHGRRHGRPRG